MLVVDADSSGGHPERFVRFGGAVRPVRVPQTRCDRLEGLLRQAVHNAVYHALRVSHGIVFRG